MTEPATWAQEQFGSIDLGDARRTVRLVRIATSAAQSPAGTVTGVFTDDAERQGAYDFLESEHIAADALERGAGEAVAARWAQEKRLFVAVDGSSLTFVDRTGERGLGAVGTYTAGAVGLKVISALALSSDGVPLGLLRQVIWRRPVERPTNRRPAKKRPVDKKETRHWLDAITTSAARVDAAAGVAHLTFLVEREGDSAAILSTLVGTGHDFIVRGNWDRSVQAEDGRTWKIRNLIGHQPIPRLLRYRARRRTGTFCAYRHGHASRRECRGQSRRSDILLSDSYTSRWTTVTSPHPEARRSSGAMTRGSGPWPGEDDRRAGKEADGRDDEARPSGPRSDAGRHGSEDGAEVRSWPSVPTSRETALSGYLCTDGRRMVPRTCPSLPRFSILQLLPRRAIASSVTSP
jgi:hypothetical protein